MPSRLNASTAALQQRHAMQTFLKPTELCDCDHPDIERTAFEILKGADAPKQIALRIFLYVRDAIPFNATLNIFQKASKTLQQPVVDYCNKINVQVALLRAAGIPARCRMARMEKQVLKPFLPGLLYDRIPDPVGHFWCECHLEDRWIACESLFDRPIYVGMLAAGLINRSQIPTIDWDGENDLMLLRHWIVEEVGSYPSFDDLAALAQSEGMPPKLFCRLVDWLPRTFSHQRTEKIRRR
jgi:hypothetical protein